MKGYERFEQIEGSIGGERIEIRMLNWSLLDSSDLGHEALSKGLGLRKKSAISSLS